MPSEIHHDKQTPPRRGRKGLGCILVLVLLVLLVAALLFFVPFTRTDDPGDRPGQDRAIAVDVAPVAAIDLEDVVRGVGTLEAVQSVQIKPEVNGRILSIHFSEGDFVSREQVLFRIDDEKIRNRMAAQQAALASTRTRLGNLRRNYERVASLRERNMVSEDQYDAAKTELDAVSSDVERLEAELDLTRRELADTVIRSPFDGFISRQVVDPGTFVAAGEPLATVYETDPLRISFFIAEKYAARVAKGQELYASVASYPDETFEGEVKFISPVIDEGTRKFRIRANIENPGNRLMHGSFASANLVLETRPDRPVIPEQALVPTREGYIVFVVDEENEKAYMRPVKTGLRQPGLVEITDGLEKDDLVVIYGHMQLDDESAVNISERWDPDWPHETGPGRTRSASALGIIHAAITPGG